MNIATAIRLGAVLAALLLPPAMARGQVAPVAASAKAASPAAGSRIGEQAPPLADDDLAANRGGETIVAGNQTLTAVTTGNVLNGSYAAGSVVLSDRALSNFNGIGNFAINTGAQVSIQSGMNLTINVAP